MDTKKVVRAFDNARKVMIDVEAIMAREKEHRRWTWKKFEERKEVQQNEEAPVLQVCPVERIHVVKELRREEKELKMKKVKTKA